MIEKGDVLVLKRNGKVKKAGISKIKKILQRIPVINKIFRKWIYSPGRIVGIALEDAKKGGCVRFATHGIITVNPKIEE